MTTTTMRRVTAADVAREAGVSRATVGFVLNGTKGQTISAATTKKVREAASKLGYTPHRQAQALRSGRSKIVLMVLPDWPLEHQMRVHLEQVAQVLDDAGLTLVTHTHRSHGQQSGQPIWAAIDPLAVVGLEPFSARDVASMRQLNITNIIPAPDQTDLSALGQEQVFDPSVAHVLQVAHLLERGHQHVAFATPTDTRLHNLAQERLNYVRTACERAGIPQPFVLSPENTNEECADYPVSNALEERVTAVIAYNDDVAADVIRSVIAQSLSVPGDVAVIGHDDSPLAARFIPSITSVRVDHRLLGQYVGHLVLESIGQGDGTPFPHVDVDVVARMSTSGPGAQR
ncbi:LacI family DNA-binding transcriptional regulator [Arthrobacter sp. MDB2-24]